MEVTKQSYQQAYNAKKIHQSWFATKSWKMNLHHILFDSTKLIVKTILYMKKLDVILLVGGESSRFNDYQKYHNQSQNHLD